MKKYIILLLVSLFIAVSCTQTGGPGSGYAPPIATNSSVLLSVEYAGNWTGQYDLNDAVVATNGYGDWNIVGVDDGNYVELNVTKQDITSSKIVSYIKLIEAYDDGAIVTNVVAEKQVTNPNGTVMVQA